MEANLPELAYIQASIYSSVCMLDLIQTFCDLCSNQPGSADHGGAVALGEAGVTLIGYCCAGSGELIGYCYAQGVDWQVGKEQRVGK